MHFFSAQTWQLHTFQVKTLTSFNFNFRLYFIFKAFSKRSLFSLSISFQNIPKLTHWGNTHFWLTFFLDIASLSSAIFPFRAVPIWPAETECFDITASEKVDFKEKSFRYKADKTLVNKCITKIKKKFFIAVSSSASQ